MQLRPAGSGQGLCAVPCGSCGRVPLRKMDSAGGLDPGQLVTRQLVYQRSDTRAGDASAAFRLNVLSALRCLLGDYEDRSATPA